MSLSLERMPCYYVLIKGSTGRIQSWGIIDTAETHHTEKGP